METNVPEKDGQNMVGVPQFSRQRLSSLIDERANGKVRQLAEKIGVTPQTVYNWKRGPQVPDAHQLSRLADALFANISDFYESPGTKQ